MSEAISKEILFVHKDRLEEDCSNQAQLVYIWGTKLAEARLKTKKEKNHLKLITADLTRRIMSNPLQFGFDKATVAAVEAAIELDDEHQGAVKDLIEAEYEEDMIEALVKSLNDRRDELRNMVLLHGQQYWSKPDTTVESRTEAMRGTTKKKGS